MPTGQGRRGRDDPRLVPARNRLRFDPAPVKRRRMPNVEYRGMNLIVPDNDSEWREYLKAAREPRLLMRKGAACGLLRYPPGRGCPWCSDLGWSWQEVSGRGTINSYEIVVQA